MPKFTKDEYRAKWLEGQRKAAPQQPESWYQYQVDRAVATAIKAGLII